MEKKFNFVSPTKYVMKKGVSRKKQTSAKIIDPRPRRGGARAARSRCNSSSGGEAISQNRTRVRGGGGGFRV